MQVLETERNVLKVDEYDLMSILEGCNPKSSPVRNVESPRVEDKESLAPLQEDRIKANRCSEDQGTLSDVTMKDEELNDPALRSPDSTLIKSVGHCNISRDNQQISPPCNREIPRHGDIPQYSNDDSMLLYGASRIKSRDLLRYREDCSMEAGVIPGLGDLREQEQSSTMFWGKFQEGSFYSLDPPPFSYSVPSWQYPKSSTSHHSKAGVICKNMKETHNPSFSVQKESELRDYYSQLEYIKRVRYLGDLGKPSKTVLLLMAGSLRERGMSTCQNILNIYVPFLEETFFSGHVRCQLIIQFLLRAP